jgi:glycosyltransferase involved in cell wall biosynthesis
MALPIVTTRSAGCVDVVEDGVNGLLVPVRDGAAVSAALLRLVKDSDLRARFGQESRRRAIALFDLSRVAGRTREIYRTLLNGATIPSARSQVATSPTLS